MKSWPLRWAWIWTARIRSDLLKDLITGLLDDAGSMGDSITDTNEVEFIDMVKKISWNEDGLTLLFDSKKLYGDGIAHGDMEIVITRSKDTGVTHIAVSNVHSGETASMNLTIDLENVDPNQVPVNDTAYQNMDLSSINRLYSDFVNTAAFKEYRISGTANVEIDFALAARMCS